VCVCNFEPRNIAGFSSELLLLGAKDAQGNVILLNPRSEVAVGQAVF
jgi:tRNA-binding protein